MSLLWLKLQNNVFIVYFFSTKGLRFCDFSYFCRVALQTNPMRFEQQMKRICLIICFVGAFVASVNLRAQTPEEVVERMSIEFAKGDSLGKSFDFVMSIPIIGTFRSTNYVLGDKLRIEVDSKDEKSIFWSDGITNWDYDVVANEVKITKAKPKENTEKSGNTELITGVSEGYDLSFDKKTDDKVWYIVCKKNKSNKEKDDPKRIDLAVSKADYSTIYLKTKSKGISISMENFKIGVTEAKVTFNPADYPNAKIIDER